MQFPTQKFIEFSKQYDIPAYVKSASTQSFADIADPRTKAACYFAKFATLVGETEIAANELTKRADIFNIGSDISALETNYKDFKQKAVKTASATTEKYPLRNREEVGAAIKWLNKNAYAIPLPDRRELAGRLLKKAEEHLIPIDDQLSKFAGLGTGDIRILIPNLQKRAGLIRMSKLHTADQREKTASDLEAIVEIARMQPNHTTETDNLDKIAATLQFLDNEYGLQWHYAGSYIDPPDSATFVHNVNTADEIEKYACKLGAGVYDIRDFERIKLADVIDTFGADFATVMTDGLMMNHAKIATVLDVMTDIEKNLFIDLVKEAGIQPQYYQQETIPLKELTKLFAESA